MSAASARPSGRVTPGALASLLLLLVAPAGALSRLVPEIDWRVLFGAPLAISGFTFFSYRADKRRAEAGESRIPESTLHLTEALGGWPGAFLAQRLYRHKTAKVSYRVMFWLIVVAHQYAAVDSLLGWRGTSAVLRLVKTYAG